GLADDGCRYCGGVIGTGLTDLLGYLECETSPLINLGPDAHDHTGVPKCDRLCEDTITARLNARGDGRARWYRNFGTHLKIRHHIILHEDGGGRERTDSIAIFGSIQKCDERLSAAEKRERLRCQSRRAWSVSK